MKKIVLLLIPFVFMGCKSTNKGPEDKYLVMVSMDACRWDYPDIYELQNFKKMEQSGVRAERVISSFPTKTFPNHYSIVTGLYPDHHGLINNTFFAPDLDQVYSIMNREAVGNGDFYGGEPLWNTAESQGMKSASFFWVGSEAEIDGIRPSYWKKYEHHFPFSDRIDTVIHWLSLPIEQRPQLIFLYFHEPDGIGHAFGPVSEETDSLMQEMDVLLGELRQKLSELPIGDKINLIVTADHGMGEISSERYVNWRSLVKDDWIADSYGYNPMYLIDVHDGFEDSVVNALNTAEGLSAWKKDELPEALNYGTHPRMSDVIAVADSSWSIGSRDAKSKIVGGTHGYDCRNMDMHAIFYAEGPAFKKGYRHQVFENVDIYPLVTEILGLEPAEVDGKLEDVEGMLLGR